MEILTKANKYINNAVIEKQIKQSYITIIK